MASFVKGGGITTPFGRNEYMRSTKNTRYESYTFAAASLPAVTIDGHAGQKILQSGVALAKITSGPDAGKVGPFQAAGTGEVDTITKGGTWTSGSYKLTVEGDTTAAIPIASTAAQILAALEAAGVEDVTVTGGPLSTTPVVLTWSTGGDQVDVTVDVTGVTGSSPTAAVTKTDGTAGAADGRGTLANLVGINDTFLPWTLVERDVEIAALQHGVPVQAWCFEMNTAGLFVPLSNTTADAMRSTKLLDLNFA